MKKFTTFLTSLLFSISAMSATPPAITLTTASAIGSTFSFTVEITNTAGLSVDFGSGSIMNYVYSTVGTYAISGTLSSHTVTIYSNSYISEIYCSSKLLTSIDLSKYTALTVLECNDNQLTALDVSTNTALTDLYCENNQLITLDVSKNTALLDLACRYNKISVLNLSTNTQLNWLLCSYNQLSTLNTTSSTALKTLYCDHNQLTSLNVTNCFALIYLYCNHNQLTTINISTNSAMTRFVCDSNKLTTLNVSANTALVKTNCSNNKITSLYLSTNTLASLQELHCSNNLISSLDVSGYTSLTDLECNNNNLTFATLPVKKAAWTNYIYAPQNPIFIAKTLPRGGQIDLSNQLTVPSTSVTTNYTLKNKSGTNSTLVLNTDYTFSGGKYVFQNATDSIYCEMTNTSFPNLTGTKALRTTCTKVGTGSGIETLETTGIKIYSRYHTLFINTPTNTQVSIFDINGRLVICKNINSGENSIPLNNAGVYLVKLTGDKNAFTRKVVIE